MGDVPANHVLRGNQQLADFEAAPGQSQAT